MPVTPLRTERLLLRAWEDSDADAVLDIYSREDVYRWLGNPPTPCPDLDAARARIARWNALSTSAREGLWAVETPGISGISPQPCGTALLVPLTTSSGEKSDTREIGWHFHPDAWGFGIATESARALIGQARANGLGEVHAVVYPDNVRSLAVCDRLGMTRLGVTDQWYGVELVDHVLAL
ncbi:GNAT family N-acetyltransferase [Longivirga aurantiaca]|uniref:GNAT family N-acetyltransferase n=1 Tax=Longivirga aurantiaca TaxID=1837743 RepID=A0ABW1SVX4_9ACTN